MRRLYWSTLETYEACPRKLLWSWGVDNIDVGGGPGKPKPSPVKSSEHHAFMGTVLSKVIEHLYNDELWRDPKNLAEKIREVTHKEFIFCQNGRYIDWQHTPPRRELLDICLKGALGYLSTMKHNKLLGTYARSEVDFTGKVGDYYLAGRPDIVIRREDTGLMILDGKNSQNPGKYTNPDQLRWYALCHKLVTGEVPNRVAFVYFRFPYGKPPEGQDPATWTGLVEVSFDMESLVLLQKRGLATFEAISNHQFEPTPTSDACHFCDYQTVCDARVEQKAARARKPRGSEPAQEGTLSSLLDETQGILTFGFERPKGK